MLDCYIINLDRSIERWEKIKQYEGFRKFNIIRVTAVDGAKIQLPHPDISLNKYFWLYGRKPLPGVIGSCFSDIKAMKLFLESKQSHCIICEDDVEIVDNLDEILESALKYADTWDIVRLFSSRTQNISYADLCHGYKLATPLRPGSSNGGYLLNRLAAEKFLRRYVPMWKPTDVALFADMPFLREAIIYPFPLNMPEGPSDIADTNQQTGMTPTSKNYPIFHPASIRFLTVIPIRLFSRTMRYISNYSTAILRRLCVKKR
jgi:glycosyl transferase family 25